MMKPGDVVRGVHPYHNTCMILHPDVEDYNSIGYVRAGEIAFVIDVLRYDDEYCDIVRIVNTGGIVGWVSENQLEVVNETG